MDADTRSPRPVVVALLGAAAMVMAAAPPAAAQSVPRPPQPRWCLPFAVMQHTYDGDLDPRCTARIAQ